MKEGEKLLMTALLAFLLGFLLYYNYFSNYPKGKCEYTTPDKTITIQGDCEWVMGEYRKTSTDTDTLLIKPTRVDEILAFDDSSPPVITSCVCPQQNCTKDICLLLDSDITTTTTPNNLGCPTPTPAAQVQCPETSLTKEQSHELLNLRPGPNGSPAISAGFRMCQLKVLDLLGLKSFNGGPSGTFYTNKVVPENIQDNVFMFLKDGNGFWLNQTGQWSWNVSQCESSALWVYKP